jgi:hypothetical protein
MTRSIDAGRLAWTVAALHGAAIGGLWGPWFLGLIALPSPFGAGPWMRHELIFGVLPLVAAGAAWRQRGGAAGAALAAVLLAWAAGRVVMAADIAGPLGGATLAMALPAVVLGQEALTGRRWAWMGLGGGLIVAGGLFHWQAWRYGVVDGGVWLGLGVALPGLLAIAPERRPAAASGGLAGALAIAGWAAGDSSLLGAALMAVLAGPLALGILSATRPRTGRASTAIMAVSTLAVTAATAHSGWILPLLPVAWGTWVVAFGLAAAGMRSTRPASPAAGAAREAPRHGA